MYHKSRRYRRRQRELKIRHKEAIIRTTWCDAMDDGMPVRGTLSKGKIHCTCWFCSFHSYPTQDRKRAASMMFDLQDEDLAIVAGATLAKLQKAANNADRRKYCGTANTQRHNMHCDFEDYVLQTKYHKLTLYINDLRATLYDSDNWEMIEQSKELLHTLYEERKALETLIRHKQAS